MGYRGVWYTKWKPLKSRIDICSEKRQKSPLVAVPVKNKMVASMTYDNLGKSLLLQVQGCVIHQKKPIEG